MVLEKEIQRIPETSQVKLRIKVNREEAKAEYEKLLKEYAKKAHVDGFRRGKVPPSVLERKYGEAIRLEAGQNIMENALKEVFSQIDEKPLATSMPILEEGSDVKPDFEKDFQFTVTYDVFPEITLGNYRGLEVSQPVVKVTEEDEQRELEALVEQNSFIVEKDQEGAAEGDLATVNYWEVDESGKEIPQTRRSDYVLMVGKGQTLYDFEGDMLGMKKGEVRVISKTYPTDYRFKDFAGTTKRIAVELVTLKEKKRPELNDELAQDISEKYKTLEDLKQDIRKRLEESAQNRVRALTIERLMEKVLESSSLVVPESMVRAELDLTWTRFVEQSRLREDSVIGILKEQGKTKEDLLREWRPQAEKSLKVRLLIEAMMQKEKVEATEEEVDALIKEQAANVSMQPEELRSYYEKNGYLESLKHDIKEKKLFDSILADTKLTPGEEVKLMDILKGKH